MDARTISGRRDTRCAKMRAARVHTPRVLAVRRRTVGAAQRPRGFSHAPLGRFDPTLNWLGHPAPRATEVHRMSNAIPAPLSVTLHQGSRVLEIGYADGQTFRLPFELLRVYSPSAEVQGHGPGQEVLQTGKRDVQIVELAPVGNYAVQPKFSDGHDTGIFSWGYLYELGSRQQEHWDRYLKRLDDAGVERDAPMVVAASGHGCGHEH
jgi:DUF971 family protein